REVETRDAGDGERVRVRVAVAGEPIDLGTSRVWESEQARALVEGLTGCIVESAAAHGDLVPAAIADVEQQGMAAAREQAGERRLEVERLQVQRRQVTVEVI